MRESDIRPADLLNEYLRLSARDAGRLLAAPGNLRPRPCPGCGAAKARPAFEKSGFAYVTCADCGTLYTDPAPDAEALAAFYTASEAAEYWSGVFFPAVTEARRVHVFEPRARDILDLLEELGRASRRAVDVGAGNGLFLDVLRSLAPGLSLAGVEPAAHAADVCRDLGFEVFEGFADAAGADPAWAGGADLVTSFEVIEHVPDPLDFLTSLTALAKPGGTVLVTGLSGDGFDIKTLGPKAKAVSPPHHLNFLSRRGVAALLDRAGLVELDFLTPGRLDVDIVRNILAEDDSALADPFLRHLMNDVDDATRAAFQAFLAGNRLSSHMWIVAGKP